MTYHFLQQYWWFLVSLLAALFVFLTFVQGANSQIFSLGRDEAERRLIVNATGRKWEFTFTTLVTFGGAFFASFPLFYSTSFGGAYWVWMLILFSFILQAVAYEFQSKPGNVFGTDGYRRFLVLNGIFGPFLVGVAVGTFFNGAEFVVCRDAMATGAPISTWAGAWHGLEAVGNPWNLVLGFAVLMLSRTLGALYLQNNIDDDGLQPRFRRSVIVNAALFLLFFLPFTGHLLTTHGWAVGNDGTVFIEDYKYLHNLLELPLVLVLFLAGVASVLAGLFVAIVRQQRSGIWYAGTGSVLTVLALLLIAGLNGTCYYPSLADTQSSLHIGNSSSSEFTLYTMTLVSALVPFVLAYIVWAWRSIDIPGLSRSELERTEHKY